MRFDDETSDHECDEEDVSDQRINIARIGKRFHQWDAIHRIIDGEVMGIHQQPHVSEMDVQHRQPFGHALGERHWIMLHLHRYTRQSTHHYLPVDHKHRPT